MKAFLDTSVLIASFYDDDPRHRVSFDLLSNLDKTAGATAAHSMAEVYSTLTGMPGRHRVSGEHALLFLGSIRERLRIVALDEEEHFHAIETFALAGIAGGAIYDALLAECALKTRAEILYTWNIKDFKRLGSAVSRRVKRPDEA